MPGAAGSLNGFENYWPAYSCKRSLISLQQMDQTPYKIDEKELENIQSLVNVQQGSQFHHHTNTLPDEVIKEQFENHYRENEEFLLSFEVLQEDLHHQIQSILFQQEKLAKLYRGIEDLSRHDIHGVLQTALDRKKSTEGKQGPDEPLFTTEPGQHCLNTANATTSGTPNPRMLH